MDLSAPKALGARVIAAQEREVTAIHQRDAAGDEAVNSLAQRSVLPFDRRDVARFGIEQDGGDLAPAHAFEFAIKRTNLQSQSSTL